MRLHLCETVTCDGDGDVGVLVTLAGWCRWRWRVDEPETVVVEVVVGGERDESAPTDGQREEHLHGRVAPQLQHTTPSMVSVSNRLSAVHRNGPSRDFATSNQAGYD